MITTRHLAVVLSVLAPACNGETPEAAVDDQAVVAAVQQALVAASEKRFEDVHPLLASWLDRSSPPIDVQWVAGWAAYELGLYAEADERLGDAVARRPEFLPNAVALGFARRRLGDFEGARDLFESIVAVRGDAHKAHYGLAMIALDEGRTADARAHVDRALAIDPEYLKAGFARARVLEEEGRLPEARTAYFMLLSQWPSHEEALYRLAQILSALGEEDEAARILEQRAQVYATNEEIAGLLARRRSGDDDPAVRARIAKLYVELGEMEDARVEVRNGLRRFPDDAALLQLQQGLRFSRQ